MSISIRKYRKDSPPGPDGESFHIQSDTTCMRASMKRIFALFAFSLMSTVALSQQVLRIEVSDTTGNPLYGTVLQWQVLDGSKSGSAISDKTGHFSIDLNGLDSKHSLVLRFQHLSYIPLIDTINLAQTLQNGYRVQLSSHLFNLGEQVITAQYSPGSTDKAVHKVTVIDRQKIDNMAAVTLKDVLANSVNIRISQDNILGSGMSMQGISGENVKIMIDGVPIIGRLDGNIDLSQINLNDVERIEIVEGPLSVNYGTNALAGTINIITKKGSIVQKGAGATAYFENIGTHNLVLNGQTNLFKTGIRASLGRNYFDGWNADDGFWPSYEKTLADSNRSKQWNPKEQYFGRLNVSRSIKSWNLNYRFETFDEHILNRGLPRAPYAEVAFDDHYGTTRADNALVLSREFKHHRFNLVAAHNHFQRVKNTYVKDLTTLQEELTPGTGDQDTSRFRQLMNRATWSSMKEGWLNYQIGYDLSYESAFGRRIESKQATMGDYSLFASTEIEPIKGLLLRPALRATHNTVYQAPLTPSFNLKWQKKNLALRASYARGFRAPSLKELYFMFFDINHNIEGNTNLKAERSNNYTAHLQYKHLLKNNIVKLELNGYYNSISNMITLAQINDDQVYSYVNIGEFTSKGVRGSISLMHNQWNGSLTYNYLGRSNTLSDEGLPPFSFSQEVAGNIQYHFRKQGIRLAGFYKYQGKLQTFAIDESDQVIQTFISAYQMADFTISKDLLKGRLSIATGFKNLFNVKNVAATTATGTHTTSATNVSVGTGRTWFVRLKLSTF